MTRSRSADLSALLSTAVERALRAPSVHNTQPWRWRITSSSIELHADGDRHLAATDPDRRDLLLSRGAALHHLQVALAALDMPVRVHRLPDPEDLDHLATVEILPSSAGLADSDSTDSTDVTPRWPTASTGAGPSAAA